MLSIGLKTTKGTKPKTIMSKRKEITTLLNALNAQALKESVTRSVLLVMLKIRRNVLRWGVRVIAKMVVAIGLIIITQT